MSAFFSIPACGTVGADLWPVNITPDGVGVLVSEMVWVNGCRGAECDEMHLRSASRFYVSSPMMGCGDAGFLGCEF